MKWGATTKQKDVTAKRARETETTGQWLSNKENIFQIGFWEDGGGQPARSFRERF